NSTRYVINHVSDKAGECLKVLSFLSEKLATEKFSLFPPPFGALYTLFSFFSNLRAFSQFDVSYLKMTPKYGNQPLKNKKSV
ncbi:hypothetical protein, partial [Salmonella enterica]|uniref:hypothetical protein n=1 Tax=Salmonella enterica TaxID=28901 RepID=UPI003F1C5E57